MLSGTICVLAGENGDAGLELPILRAGFQTTDYYSVECTGLDNSCGVREPILCFSVFSAHRLGSFSPPLLSGGFLESGSRSNTLDLVVTNRRLWLLHVGNV